MSSPIDQAAHTLPPRAGRPTCLWLADVPRHVQDRERRGEPGHGGGLLGKHYLCHEGSVDRLGSTFLRISWQSQVRLRDGTAIFCQVGAPVLETLTCAAFARLQLWFGLHLRLIFGDCATVVCLLFAYH